MGIVLNIIDLRTGEHRIRECFTIHAAKSAALWTGLTEVHGFKRGRLLAHENILKLVFDLFKPHAVISESPFMGKFAAAFEALTQCLETIRRALYYYNPYLELELIDPPSAKKSVGVKAKGGTKMDVENAVKAEDEIIFEDGLSREGHEEHVYDAMAVGRWKVLDMLGRL